MDAKTSAAQIRTAARRATKTDGDALHGLTVSVRQMTGSMVTGVSIALTGLDEDEYLVPRDERDDHRGAWTDRGRAIVNRLNELAAPAYAESDGRHSFTDVTVGGTSAPLPGHFDDFDRARAAAHIEAQADAAVPALDEVTVPELCTACLEVMGACDCDSESAAKEAARNQAAAAELDDPEEYARFAAALAEHRGVDTRPACPNGHGPMVGRATIREDAQAADALGHWHTCTTPRCGESLIRPSQVLIHALASVMGARVTPDTAADPVEFGTRRGALAAVR